MKRTLLILPFLISFLFISSAASAASLPYLNHNKVLHSTLGQPVVYLELTYLAPVKRCKIGSYSGRINVIPGALYKSCYLSRSASKRLLRKSSRFLRVTLTIRNKNRYYTRSARLRTTW